MRSYKKETRQGVIHFNSNGLAACADFSQTPEGFIEKKLLVLVEGTHVDSKKRTHHFPEERIYEIAERSNAAFENGARIPLLTDHNKTQFSTVGDLESSFEVQEITEDNLPNPRHRHLLGKLGIFASKAIIKSKDAIKQAKEGLLSTISPGIDPVTNEIKEISFTPTPAITGLMAFKQDGANSTQALSFYELEQPDSQFEDLEENYEDLTEKLWIITKTALTLTDDEQVNPEEVIGQALQDFADRYMQLIGMDGGSEEENYDSMQQNQGAGNYPAQQNTQGAMQPPQNFRRAPVAAFSMAELEHLNNIEFSRNKKRKIVKSKFW